MTAPDALTDQPNSVHFVAAIAGAGYASEANPDDLEQPAWPEGFIVSTKDWELRNELKPQGQKWMNEWRPRHAHPGKH